VIGELCDGNYSTTTAAAPTELSGSEWEPYDASANAEFISKETASANCWAFAAVITTSAATI
jgi:hypothetical protein